MVTEVLCLQFLCAEETELTVQHFLLGKLKTLDVLLLFLALLRVYLLPLVLSRRRTPEVSALEQLLAVSAENGARRHKPSEIFPFLPCWSVDV